MKKEVVVLHLEEKKVVVAVVKEEISLEEKIGK
jgi:hypothetical protein